MGMVPRGRSPAVLDLALDTLRIDLCIERDASVDGGSRALEGVGMRGQITNSSGCRRCSDHPGVFQLLKLFG